MYMIFSFSGQAGDTSSDLSFRVSRKIVSIGNEVLGTNLAEDRIDHYAERINGFVRKLAHVTEYFALAVAVAFPLYVYGLRGMLLMLLAGAFCVAFACGDEFHQSFVSGRTPSKRDVCIDSIGIFFGILVVRMVGWTGRMTIFRSKSPEPEQPQPNPYYRPVPPRNPDSYPGASRRMRLPVSSLQTIRRTGKDREILLLKGRRDRRTRRVLTLVPDTADRMSQISIRKLQTADMIMKRMGNMKMRRNRSAASLFAYSIMTMNMKRRKSKRKRKNLLPNHVLFLLRNTKVKQERGSLCRNAIQIPKIPGGSRRVFRVQTRIITKIQITIKTRITPILTRIWRRIRRDRGIRLLFRSAPSP